MRARLSHPPTRFTLVAIVATTACGAGDGSTLNERGQPVDQPFAPGLASQFGASIFTPTYESIAVDFLEPFCADCHSGGSPAKGLELTLDTAYDQMVNVSSLQRPGTLMVAPGAPEQSYLVIKLEGSGDFVGRQMPRGRAARPQSEIDIIRTWIADGAERN